MPSMFTSPARLRNRSLGTVELGMGSNDAAYLQNFNSNREFNFYKSGEFSSRIEKVHRAFRRIENQFRAVGRALQRLSVLLMLVYRPLTRLDAPDQFCRRRHQINRGQNHSQSHKWKCTFCGVKGHLAEVCKSSFSDSGWLVCPSSTTEVCKTCVREFEVELLHTPAECPWRESALYLYEKNTVRPVGRYKSKFLARSQ